MNKKSYGKKGQSSKKNPFEDRKFFECGELGHIVINCPNKKRNKKDKNDNDNNKKKFLKKKKNGQAYYVEWDSDASSDEDDDDDDDKPSKGVAGIAIKGAPSLFTTPHCLMAKGGAKVQQDDELSYDDLVEMLNDADEFMTKEKAKLRYLKVEVYFSSRFL